MDDADDYVPTLDYDGRVFRFPFHGEIRLLTPAEAADLRQSISDRGVFNPIWVTVRDEVIDGENRLRFARGAGLGLNRLDIKQLDVPEEEARKLVAEMNEKRRQLSPQDLAANRERREKRVQVGVRDGKTERAIAAEEGCAKTTVHRDKENALLGPGGPSSAFSGTTQKVKVLLEEGLPQRAIARELGLKLATVRRAVKEIVKQQAQAQPKRGRPTGGAAQAEKRRQKAMEELQKAEVSGKLNVPAAAPAPRVGPGRQTMPCSILPSDPQALVRWVRKRAHEKRIQADDVPAWEKALEEITQILKEISCP